MTAADFIPLALLALVFFLLIIRPMRERQKQFTALRQMQDALQPGVRVMISSGIHGTVRSLDDDTIGLEIAPGVVVTVARAAVAEVAQPNEPTEPTE
ncbi:preprotein translocase subunit YajC [Aeromicrobium senzhongii]|nr:preprotein translocase subunit YajC [Aeromicrobium senzhongii]QNL95600.1 preprotein translocase subunit YajC [Aeromicrobium senzhongii]